jgi:hypothetical protein
MQVKENVFFYPYFTYLTNNCQAAEGIWTPDLLITNQPLHQLSYGGTQRPE